MSKELHEWSHELISKTNASKYFHEIHDLPDCAQDCANSLRYVARKNNWRVEVKKRGETVRFRVVSKAKIRESKRTRNPMTDRVRGQMLKMKPGEHRRFLCERIHRESARRAVYAVRDKIGGRFSTTTSKDGFLIIIRN